MGEQINYTTEEILDMTQQLYCFGLYDDGEARKIEFARTLQPEEKVVIFGIGYGARDCIITALANPDIHIFAFDYGRHDWHVQEDFLIHVHQLLKDYQINNVYPWISEATVALPCWKSKIGALFIDTDGAGTGDQLRRWAKFVRPKGKIFVQNYGLSHYAKIKEEVDEFLKENTNIILGEQTPKTENGSPQLRELDVI